MRKLVFLTLLLSAVAPLRFSPWRTANVAASAGQGKGSEVIAKRTPTPKPESSRPPARPKPPAENAKSLPAKFTNQYRMEFVLISAGKFMMGSADGSDSEKPIHGVSIAHAFYLGRYEVTQGTMAGGGRQKCERAAAYGRERFRRSASAYVRRGR